jgi:hypothetical protein
MKKRERCDFCFESFEDGDFVAAEINGEKGAYHSNIDSHNKFEHGKSNEDCIGNFSKDAIRTINFEVGIFYNGIIFPLSSLPHLDNYGGLGIKNSEDLTGQKIVGTISGLENLDF